MGRKREGPGMVRVRVLGGVELSIGSRRIGMNTEVLFGLALYLTTRAGERVPRDQLLDLFWAKGADEQRRHALRQMMYRLRQKGLVLDEDGEYLSIARDRVQSDLREVLDGRWPERATAAEIDAAATFSPVFSRRMAPGFVEWLDDVRDRAVAQHRKASLRQITVARREGRWADLERWAQSVLRSDPLNEEATLARAESAAMAGSKTVALEILDTYLAELGEIAPELSKPALALRKRLAERRADWTMRGPKEVALVGRTDLMSRLTGLVDAAYRGEGSAVMLVGAPGIGKTRLAMETLGYAELKGMRTVVVRAEAGTTERPLSLVQQLISSLLQMPGAAGCHPESFASLRRVVSDSDAPWHGELASNQPESVARLSASFVDLCRAISLETRVAIFADDVHNADLLSFSPMSALMRAIGGTRVLLVCASRRREGGAVDSLPWDHVSLVQVPSLSTSATAELATATAAAHRITIGAAGATRLAEVAAGNPLFVRELCIAGVSNDSRPLVPESLSHLIADRLGRLSRMQLRLLRAIALLGDAATVGRLTALAESSQSDLSSTIDMLEQDGILGLGPGGSLRLHDCWREAIIDALTPASKVALAFECASLLSSQRDSDASPESLWRAADLFALAGETARALNLYLSAAERLDAIGMPTAAIEVLERSSALVISGAQRGRVGAWLGRSHLLVGNTEKALSLAEAAVRELATVEDSHAAELAMSHCVRAEALLKLSRKSDDALADLVELTTEGRIAPHLQLTACLFGIRLAANSSHDDAARWFFRRSREIEARTSRSLIGWLTAIVYQAELGTIADIRAEHRWLESRDLSGVSTYDFCRVLRFKCHSLRIAGLLAEAIASGEEAFRVAATNAMPHDARLAAELLTFVYLDNNDVDSSELWIDKAREMVPQSEYGLGSVSLSHAEDRLRLQRGDWQPVFSRLSARLDAIKADGAVRSRCGELSTLAYSAAMLGLEAEARSSVEQVLDELPKISGSFSGDYPTELAVRTLSALGNHREAVALAQTHVSEKRRRGDLPLPPFCRELRATEAAPGLGDGNELSRIAIQSIDVRGWS